MQVEHADPCVRTARRVVEAGVHLVALEVGEGEIVPASVCGNGAACVSAVIPRS